MPDLADNDSKTASLETKTKISAAWRAYGEVKSEEDILKSHMPLVRSVVDRMRASLPPQVDVEDLYSVGLLGLINANRRFDPTLGVNFSRHIALEAGYRYMYIDYDKDNFLYNVNMPGIFAGLLFKF
jgi:hypothetical protein